MNATGRSMVDAADNLLAPGGGPEPCVGLFWFVENALVAAGLPISRADRYGDCLTYDGGHAEHWDAWEAAGPAWLRGQGLPIAILSTEYDAHPRGRVIFDQNAKSFMIYADRRLHGSRHIGRIKEQFTLKEVPVRVEADAHYR